MKKTYTKPLIEIEAYELNASIAQNCGYVITLGPGIPGSEEYKMCKEFIGSGFLNLIPEFGLMNDGTKSFYSDGAANCDCYYTSGGQGYFTS